MTLDNLIDEAERENKWLFCYYQQLWFSPAELRTANAGGQFRWGAQNFELRDPAERLQQLQRSLDRKQVEAETFKERLQSSMSTSLGDK